MTALRGTSGNDPVPHEQRTTRGDRVSAWRPSSVDATRLETTSATVCTIVGSTNPSAQDEIQSSYWVELSSKAV
jgi:hypothetical protein